MKTVFIIGDACCPLTYERGLTVINLGFEVFWYSTCDRQVPGATMLCKWPSQSRIRRSSIVRSTSLIYYYLRLKPDLVHVFYGYHGVITTLTLSIFKNVIITVMGSDILLFHKRQPFKKLVVNRLIKRASKITAKSKFLEERIFGFGCDSCQVSRLNWGVDLNLFTPNLNIESLRKQYRLNEKDFILFSHRGCKPIYQNKIIIKGFASFLIDHATGNQSSYLIISTKGSAIYKAHYCEILQLVSDFGLDNNVIFAPFISHADMPYYYCLSDACISIPYSDGLPQSLFEAMACQCYPLLGDLAQYKEVEEAGGYYGKVFGFTEKAVKHALVSILNDPEGIERKNIKNRTFIKTYANKASETEKLSSIYNGIISDTRPV